MISVDIFFCSCMRISKWYKFLKSQKSYQVCKGFFNLATREPQKENMLFLQNLVHSHHKLIANWVCAGVDYDAVSILMYNLSRAMGPCLYMAWYTLSGCISLLLMSPLNSSQMYVEAGMEGGLEGLEGLEGRGCYSYSCCCFSEATQEH